MISLKNAPKDIDGAWRYGCALQMLAEVDTSLVILSSLNCPLCGEGHQSGVSIHIPYFPCHCLTIEEMALFNKICERNKIC